MAGTVTALPASLAGERIVPVVVIDDAGWAVDAAAALAAGGIGCVEITLRTAAGLDAIGRVAAAGSVLVGAGTVLRPDDVDLVAAAGARFIVTPGFDPEVVERALALGLDVLPGTATATEVQAALRAGLSAVKLFPADRLGGLDLITSLSGPFPDVAFVPSGGVSAANLRAYLDHPRPARGARRGHDRAPEPRGDRARRMTDRGIVTVGETMGLLRATSVGSLEHVSDFALHIGGAESNVAIGVSRLGRPALWIGRVGDDAVGRRVLRELRAEAVGTHVVVDPEARTGLMLKETPTAGTTRVLYYRAGSAGSRLVAADLDLDAIRAAGILHVTGITLALSETAADAIRSAVTVATEAGVPVSFDVNHRASLWVGRDPRPAYRWVAERADVVFAGDDEAALLVGAGEPPDLAKRLAALGPAQAIVKLGERGAVAHLDGADHVVAAVPVTPLDTVGAGDAFVAGYLVGLLDGLAPTGRLELAARCGAFACLGPGDWESLPRRADLIAPGASDPVVR